MYLVRNSVNLYFMYIIIPPFVSSLVISVQERGNYFEVGGGGGQTSSGVQGSPYPKLKTPWMWSTIPILEWTQVHVQKLTKIKMNDIDSPKLGRRRPHSFQVVGASCPHCPPPPPWFPHPVSVF